MQAESFLEETLVANPDPLDLLGVDEDGRLSLFELKRGTLTRDAVAQVIDYAADLEARDPTDLADLLSRESRRHGIERIEDFEEWYGQQFGGQESSSLRPLRIFLVGLGADDRAERMVDFLANNSGMDISLITFHSFEYGGRTFLARQVHVEGAGDAEARRKGRRLRVAERRARLEERVEEYGVTKLFGAATDMFRENWPNARMKPGVSGLAIKLRRHVYARVEVSTPGEVQIAFQPPAKALCLDEFRRPVAEMRHGTCPRDRDPLGDADAAIHFRLSVDDWETHKETLTRLAAAVHEAHRAGEAE